MGNYKWSNTIFNQQIIILEDIDMNKVQVALFDIDKTIISRDSMIEFVRYSFIKHPEARIEMLKAIKKIVQYTLKKCSKEEVKEAIFVGINYFSEQDLHKFYEDVIKRYIYRDAIKKMQELKTQGYKIVLVTASPECYMKYFNEIPEVDWVIGTRLQQINGKYINKITGKNCKGIEKVKRINELMNKYGLEIETELSYAFSDSLSDVPMFDLVKNSYLINSKIKRYPAKLYWR